MPCASCSNPLLIDASGLYMVSFETDCDTEIESYRTRRVQGIQPLEKTDADFMGWYASASFSGGAIEFPYELTEDTTLYARWDRKYLAVFETNGGSVVAQYRTSEIKDEPLTTKADSAFAGWFTEPDFAGERVTFPHRMRSQTVFYARWRSFYTVSFVTNGGTALTSIKTSVIDERPLSYRTGYVLAGWFLDADFSTPVAFPFALAEDVTLYAEWQALTTYTATFIVNGGTAVQSVHTAIINEPPVTEKQGYFFEGWYLDCDCTIPAVFPHTLINDTFFYAKWAAKPTYMAAFVTNGGSDVKPIYASTIFDAPVTEKHAYNFAGWYLDSEFSKSVVFPYTLTKDTTFYAKWAEKQKVKYTVEHYQQDENLSSYTRIDIETLYDIENCLTKAAQKSYAGFHAKEFSQVEIKPDGSSKVKIYYDRNAYSIRFDANGGNGTMKDQIFYYGIRQKLQKNAFAFSNHFFSGWSTAKTGGKRYADGDSIMNLSASNGDVITLYAQWDYGSVVTEMDIAYLDLSALHTEDYLVRVEGAVSPYMLEVLVEKIERSSAYIELDLSNTTGITEISEKRSYTSMFNYCYKLKKLILPKTLKTIGDYAFKFCDFSSVIIPEGVTSIGESAFESCRNLESVEIPSGVSYIGRRAFCDCTSLTSVTLPDSLTEINEETFSSTVLTSITIPKTIDFIGQSAFSGVDTLMYATFLDDKAFWEIREFGIFPSYPYNYLIPVESPLTNAKYLRETYAAYWWVRN